MNKTNIPYADVTWQVTAGCQPIGHGCQNCWAARLAATRLKKHPDYAGLVYSPMQVASDYVQWNGRVRMLWHNLESVTKSQRPRVVFVNSMGDLFHHDILPSYVDRVFERIRECNQHTYLVLTKRPHIMFSHMRCLNAYDYQHVWFGVSVSCSYDVEHVRLRINDSATKFNLWISYEPALELADVTSIPGIKCVVMGCESGPRSRPMNLDWARKTRDACAEHGIAFYLKQAKIAGKLVELPELDGRTHDELPWRRNSK